MDSVFIRGLRVETLIGVYPQERNEPQVLLLDLILAFDNRVPAASDDVADTLDYAEISAGLRELAARRKDQLLETLAEAMADYLRSNYRLRELELRVSKLAAAEALGSAAVGVFIHRRWSDS